jgi:type IV pilus assembly protein PilC
MPLFKYTAIDKDGKRITGTLEASTETAATQSLHRRELRPVSLEHAKNGNILSKLPFGAKNQKVKLKDLVVFTRQLATMIDAGVPLLRSLAALQAQTENPSFRRHIAEISKEVEGGTSFADALEKHTSVFSPIYVNMVRAGEAGGILDEILKKLATQQEKDARIRGKFKSALTYPAILLSITFMVFIVLMVFVMPRIGRIIKDLAGENAELPKLTQAMLTISSFMTSKWYVLLAVFVIGGFFLRKYVKTPGGRKNKDRLLLRIPVIKMIVKKVVIARFARIFASLMSAGVTVIDSIEITAKALGNAVIEEELMAASKGVASGQPLSVTLAGSKIFPPIVSQMLAIGEETGQTSEILVKVADFYEEEVDATVDSLSSILEPIMIVVMGGMVGLIAASVIGPISNLSNQI